MDKQKLGRLYGKTLLFLKQKSPTALSIASIIGVAVTGYSAARATPKALLICRELDEKKTDATKLDYVKAAWVCYIPTLIIGASTAMCILGANVISKKRQEAITSAYILLENSYKEYRKKMRETFGDGASDEIVSAIISDKLSKDNIKTVSDDKTLFYDTYSNEYFESTIEDVISSEYHFNRNFILRGYNTYNELLEFMGRKKVAYGDDIGWDIDFGLEFYGYQWIDFEHRQTVTDDGLEVYIISMPFEPHPLEWPKYIEHAMDDCTAEFTKDIMEGGENE